MSFQIEYIKPKLLNSGRISSWFTLRNQRLADEIENQKIQGLNLGLNTNEDDSVVHQNRSILMKDLGLTQNEIVFGNQIHKSDILVAEKAGIYADTDAFVTKTSGLALAIQVADCAAVLLGDEENGVIGAAHAGWRGAVDDIVPKVISRMKEAGAETNFIKVFISPSISQVNFEVGEEVAAQFPKQFVDFESQSKPHVNLKAFLKYQLLNSGILSVNIEIDEGCTISDENFYSYRRQKDKSGRMMGIIKLEEI